MYRYSKYDVGQKIEAKVHHWNGWVGDYEEIVVGQIVGIPYFINNSPVFNVKTQTGKIKEIHSGEIVRVI